MPKRPRDGSVAVLPPKRRQLTWDQAGHSRKRRGNFEDEVCRMNKRLRATVPTAEEAIAFLLPHVMRLRQLYDDAVRASEVLKVQNKTLTDAAHSTKKNNGILLRELKRLTSERDVLRNQCGRLNRQLEMTRYQLAMTDTRTFSQLR